MRPPFPYYGGKYHKLKWLLPLLPPMHHYCEPFGGSGVVLLNREPSPIETYNDLDGDITNFFRILRDHPNDLIRLLTLTPYSRWEFLVAFTSDQDVLSSLERARQFFVFVRQVFSGDLRSTNIGSWGYAITESNRNMSARVSKWLSAIDDVLPAAIERLRNVQIECDDAIKVICKYDSPQTLFYCDPPYSQTAYRYECDVEYHCALAYTLDSIEGLAAISGYHCDLMDTLYGDWVMCEYQTTSFASFVKSARTEVLWTNYELDHE